MDVKKYLNHLYHVLIIRNIRILKKTGRKLDERVFIGILLVITILPILLKIFLGFTLKTTLILTFVYLGSVLSLPTIIYESKMDKFDKNIPKALYVMVLSLDSGRSVVEAINEVIRSGIPEVDVVFSKIVTLMTERKLSFEDAMILVSNSLDSKIFRQVGRLIIENRKYGGELADTLKKLAKTLEDLQNLKSQLLSVTANGLAVGLIILCGVIPATAGLIGGYLTVISQLAPTMPSVEASQISKAIETIQMGSGLFGLFFAVPLFGLKVNRMIITCAVCMTFAIGTFYAVLRLTGLLFA
ncbi:type II secretion system F family protein [Methanococcus maripaludis]|uniref:type II secretion system F family protein n=1 Tax=Methanococcus maripaludis TaxID=39152 RepID=UPI003143181C